MSRSNRETTFKKGIEQLSGVHVLINWFFPRTESSPIVSLKKPSRDGFDLRV